MEQVVNCGHVAVSGIVTTGYGTNELGYTMCYGCCTAEDQEFRLPRWEVMGVYVDEKARKVKNWPGGILGSIDDIWFRGRMRYIRVTDVHGQKWHGRGSEEWDAVTIRKSKASKGAE